MHTPDSETNANDLMGVCNTPLQNAKQDEKKYLMGVCNTPLQNAQKDEKKYLMGVFNTPLQNAQKDEKKYLLGVCNTPLQKTGFLVCGHKCAFYSILRYENTCSIFEVICNNIKNKMLYVEIL